MSIVRFLLLLRFSPRRVKGGPQSQNTKNDELASRARTHLSTVLKKAEAISSAGTGNPGGILYVYLWNDKTGSSTVPLSRSLSNSISQLSQSAQILYSEASNLKSTLDVRVLLQQSNSLLSFVPLPLSQVFVEPGIPIARVEETLVQGSNGSPKKSDINILESPSGSLSSGSEVEEDGESVTTAADSVFEVVALGGTFDRLHNGHKILLTEAVLRCSKELIIGVTDEAQIKHKLLCELIEPIDQRMENVRNFLRDVGPSNLELRIIPISDPFGPTIVEENIDLLIVSDETIKGGNKINEIRKGINFKPLEIHSIQLTPDTLKESEHEDSKISSSSLRIRMLGNRLRPPKKPASLPYIVGITGGIASGKSTVCRYLEPRFPVIDCDKLAHEAYKKGTPCSLQLISTFGKEIVAPESGEIDRRVLGGLVFGNPDKLKQLTDAVWPEIRKLANEQIQRFSKEGHKIIVIDAAVLLEAKWDEMCHEVLVAFVPRDEAIKRIQERNNLTKEESERRIGSQMSNQERLAHATFAFSSIWETEFTRKQVDKAFVQIQICVDSIQSSS